MAWFNRKQRINFRQPKIYTRTRADRVIQVNKGLVWIIILIIVLSVTCWWLFYSDYFKIKNIEINGTLNEEVKREIDGFLGKNLLLFSIGQLDKKLAERQTSIEKLNIIKGIPDTIKVEVLVRKPQIRWRTQDRTYFIDENGIVFNLDEPNEELEKLSLVEDSRNLVIELGKKILTSDFIECVKQLSGEIKEATGKEIESMKVNETTIHLELKLKDSFRVLFDTTADLEKQLYLLKKTKELHESEVKEYVDLRVEKRAYYK